MIALYIRYELSYDKQYENGERIYRVVQVQHINGRVTPSTVLQAPLAETMKNEFPEIENAGRLIYFGAGKNQIRRSDSKSNFDESGFVFAEQSIIEIFDLPVLSGSQKEALNENNKIAISKRIADKFFPGEEALGKSFILNNDDQNPYTVTAVFDNFPANSHMKFDFLLALNLGDAAKQNWNFNSFHNYVLLKPGTSVSLLEEKLKTIITNYIIPFDKKQNQFFYDRSKDYYELQPVKDIHLKSAHFFSNASFDYAEVGDIRIVWVLAISAFFILLLACINFINLSIAKFTNRAKEIGLKKTIGARRGTLISHFFGESILYCSISILLAIGITILLLPYLNQLSGKTLIFPWQEWWVIPLLISIAFIIGSLVGIYPSLYLTSFNIVKTLKGNSSENRGKAHLRNGMVVFQFAASIVLIVCTLAIYKQMNFMLNKDLGFSKEQVLLLQGGNTLGNEISPFKEELKSIAGVQSVSVSSFLPIENSISNRNPFYLEDRKSIDPGIRC
jgi:putative ABC transport system permease protein